MLITNTEWQQNGMLVPRCIFYLHVNSLISGSSYNLRTGWEKREEFHRLWFYFPVTKCRWRGLKYTTLAHYFKLKVLENRRYMKDIFPVLHSSRWIPYDKYPCPAGSKVLFYARVRHTSARKFDADLSQFRSLRTPSGFTCLFTIHYHFSNHTQLT